jgi:AraC family transcriptional regulator
MSTMPEPEFRHSRAIQLAGTMVIYNSQAEATEKIPAQWHELLSRLLDRNAAVLHYHCGIDVSDDEPTYLPDRITLEEGEYAVFTVDTVVALRDTWIWALTRWLPSSGRKEKKAPEFERYSSGITSGPIEIWIPMEPIQDEKQ